MSEFSSSDSEFWDTLSDKVLLSHRSPSKVTEKQIEPSPIKAPEIKKKKIKTLDFDHQKKVFDRIVTSKYQQMIEEEIRMRNQTKKELYPSIREIVISFEKNAIDLSKQYDILKEKLLESTRDAEILQQKLLLQQKIARRLNIKGVSFIEENEVQEKSQIQEEYEVLSLQLSCLREVTSEFHKDSLKSSEVLEKVKSQIYEIKDSHNKLVDKMQKACIDKENALFDETEKMQFELNTNKMKAEQEKAIWEIIYKRQQDFIEKLFAELGGVKFIFNNPRLRQIYHTKVFKISESEAPSPKSANANKRQELMSRATKYSDNAESLNFQSRPMTRESKFKKMISEINNQKINKKERKSFTPLN